MIFLITRDVLSIRISFLSEISTFFEFYFNLIPKKSYSNSVKINDFNLSKKKRQLKNSKDVINLLKERFFSKQDYSSYRKLKKKFHEKYKIKQITTNHFYNNKLYRQWKNKIIKKNVEIINNKEEKKRNYYKLKFYIYEYLKKIVIILERNKKLKKIFFNFWSQILIINKIMIRSKFILENKLINNKKDKEIKNIYFKLWKNSKETSNLINLKKDLKTKILLFKVFKVKNYSKNLFFKNSCKKILKNLIFKFYFLEKFNKNIKIFSLRSYLKSYCF